MKRFLMTCLVVLCSLLAAMPSMGEAGGAQRIPGRVAVLAEIVDRSETMYRVQHAEQPPVIDGNIDEWAEVPAMVLDRADQGRRVSGPDDLSGSLRLLWDREALYFCLQVRDNVHSAPNPRAAWDNDCLQFALDPYMNGPGASFNEMERSYCLSDTMGGPVLSSYSVPAAGEVSHDIVAGVTVKTLMRPDGVRVFEMAMPWAKLDPAHPWVLGRLGFTFSLNDNDGEGFKGALVWTEGLLWGKDASKFGVLVFEKAVGTRNAVLELAPELNIFGDRAQSRWITLRDVDPFTSARLLVNRTQPGLVAAALSVYRPGEAEPIATGRVEEPVGAGGTVIFAWDLSGLRDGKYELVFDVPAERPETRRRIAWYKMELGELRARKGELTQRFGIDRPWDDLADAPGLIRRHRGMVAALLRLLEPDSTLAGDALVSALGDAVEMIASLDHGEDYLASRRNEFWSAYYSPVDGSGQLFTIVVPDDYDAAQRCPLLIKITDGMPTRGRAHTGQYLVVSPRCYGTRSALGLGEYDILRVLRHMKQWYSIDPGRVYAGGYSYGGFATWRIATEHPDLFAAVAPYYGGTGDLKLENLRHVPVFNQHGLKDRSVPIGMSRYGISKLQELGYPVAHKEFPEAAHGIPDPFPTLDWMMARRRVDCPATVTYTCETPENGQAYWLSIRRFIDPHVRARVTARVDGTGHYQMIALALHNVAVLELDVAAMRVERQAGLLVQVGNTFLEQAAPLPERLFVVRRETGWTLTEQWQPPVSTVRPYRPGAAANLCNGEPWMIVYGSRGKQDRADFLRRAAEHLSLLKGARLQTGGKAFPVKADRDVTGDDMAHFNLVLLGGARDNHVVARIADKLPFRINEKNELLAGSREPVSLDGAELRMLYYNPLEPGRLIFLLTTDEPSVSVDDWLTVSRNHNPMTGADGTKRGDQPDMVVQVIAGPIRRQMQFTRDWRWRDIPGSDRHLPQPMAAWRALNKAQLRVMRRMTGADFAFTWGADADDLRFDPDCITRADLAIEGTPRETLLARMTGEELIEVRAKWPGEDEVCVFPVYDKADIDPQRDYDIALPPDFCWRLTAREKNLRNAHAGPDWDVAELWAEIFDH